jgi:hypothetical protein
MSSSVFDEVFEVGGSDGLYPRIRLLALLLPQDV